MATRSLYFPIGGQNRRYAYQSQPPFTTTACLNTRPFEPAAKKERGGNRPGLIKAFTQQIFTESSPAPADPGILDLFTLDVIPLPGEIDASWRDMFTTGELEDYWTFQGDDGNEPSGFVNGALFFREASLLRPNVEGMNQQASHTVRMWCGFPVSGRPRAGATFTLFADVGDSLDWENNSIFLKLHFLPGTSVDAVAVTLTSISNGEETIHADRTWEGHNLPTNFSLAMSLNPVAGVVTASIYRGRVLDRIEQLNLADVGGITFNQRGGVGMKITPASSNPGQQSVVLSFARTYTEFTPAVLDKPRPVLVATALDGTVWSNRPGRFGDQGSDMVTANGIRLLEGSHQSGASFRGKLYMTGAESGPTVFDPTKNEVIKWVCDRYPDSNIDLAGKLKGVDVIEGDGGVPSFTLVPESKANHLLARYVGRMVLAGSPPHVMWMSRAGDPHDFDYKEPLVTDLGRSWWSAADPRWGGFPGALTALIPFSDDYLIVAQRNAIWRMLGDPWAGGGVVNVSRSVGILDRKAWCVTAESILVFMGDDGLFMLAPGGSGFPLAVSRQLIPNELLGIDPLQHRITLVYDRTDVGVHIFVVPLAGGQSLHWWFDWRTKGFWPLSLFADHVPADAVWYDGDIRTGPGTVLGCADGFLRRFANIAPLDDDRPFKNFIDYGPFRMGATDSETGVLHWIRGYPGTLSGPVNVTWRTGVTAQDAFLAPESEKRVLNGAAIRPKIGGGSIYLRVSGAGEGWQMENIDINVERTGPAKPL